MLDVEAMCLKEVSLENFINVKELREAGHELDEEKI